jgi:hypothetical protein
MPPRSSRLGSGLFVLAGVVLVTAFAGPSRSASAPITIAAHPPDLLRNRMLTLYGSIPSERPKQLVRLEARDCGQSFYRQVAVVETVAGGRWSWPYFYPGITASIRARWQDRTSAPVRVRDRAYVELRQAGAASFSASVRAKMSFEGRRVLLQRLDPARGWTTIRSALLSTGGAPPGSSYVYSSARIAAKPPAGLVRAFFPSAQAKPCYLAGRSNMLRIR